MKTIDELVADADAILMTKTAAAKAATAAPAESSSEVQKLAAQIRNPSRPAPVVKTAAAVPESRGLTFDMALSLARVEHLINLPTLSKMAALAKKAKDAGHSEEKVAEYFEKNAAAFPLQSVFSLMPWLFQSA